MSAAGADARPRRDRRRRRRRAVAVRWAARVAVVLVAFAIGVAFGQATRENPRPGGSVTVVRTLPPGQLAPTTVTVTVTTPTG